MLDDLLVPPPPPAGGELVSRMTCMDALLKSDFQLVMNDVTYMIRRPAEGNALIQLLYFIPALP